MQVSVPCAISLPATSVTRPSAVAMRPPKWMILPSQVSFPDVGKGLEDSGLLVEKFTRRARQLIAQGAEAIIPGQLYLSEAIARAGVTRIDEVPVVDGLAATLKMAEAMADLKRLGVSVTRRGYTHARPTADMIEHARTMHGRPPPAKKGA